MNYETLLKQHQLKVTPQRVGILEMMDGAGHITIENLFEQIKKRFTSISLATLYKNINSMLDTSLITEVKAPRYKTHYEITKESHAHFVCTSCGQHKDIAFDMNTLCKNLVDEITYEVATTSVILSGLCPKCKILKKML